MAYIDTGVEQPGIIELLFYKGATGKALANLAQVLLHGPSGLSPGEREIIASYVSRLNECEFCQKSHAAAANAHLGDQGETIACVIADLGTAPVSDKLKALLKIAQRVQVSGRAVAAEDVQAARARGATDEDIHDTVLIAAAFCMFNRYVDGLGTGLPANDAEYVDMGKMLAGKGYRYPPRFLRKFVVGMMNRNKGR